MNGSHTEPDVEQRKSQAQFAYLQLGLAAGAIAFAIHETEGRSLYDTPWPIGAAVLCWALSFALGCFGVTARQRTIRADAGAAGDPASPLRRLRWQLWALSTGALCYIAGHVMQMAATPSERGSVARLPYDIDRPPFPGRGPG